MVEPVPNTKLEPKKKKKKKNGGHPGVHTCDFSTQEVEAGGWQV
jgi:hypothetical protein